MSHTTNTSYTNYNSASSSFTFSDLHQFNLKIKNPNGIDKQVVTLENFKPGIVRIFRQMIPGVKPIEVGRVPFKEGQNRLSLDGDFVGIVVGEPKDETKKYQIEYIGYEKDHLQFLKETESKVNKK